MSFLTPVLMVGKKKKITPDEKSHGQCINKKERKTVRVNV